MTKGRVTQVMRQADGFDQVFVGTQGARDRASDLGDFQGVRQAGAVVIAFIVDENLGLIFQAAEGSGVQDAVAVALEGGAVFRLFIRVAAPFAYLAADPVRRQALIFNGLRVLYA